MILYVLLGLLAAFGLLCILWTVFGFLLPGCSRFTVFILCKPEKESALLRRLLWLRELGVLRCSILLSGRGLTAQQRHRIQYKYDSVEFYDQELPGE